MFLVPVLYGMFKFCMKTLLGVAQVEGQLQVDPASGAVQQWLTIWTPRCWAAQMTRKGQMDNCGQDLVDIVVKMLLTSWSRCD